VNEFFLWIAAFETFIAFWIAVGIPIWNHNIRDLETLIGLGVGFGLFPQLVLMGVLGGWAAIAIPVVSVALCAFEDEWYCKKLRDERDEKERTRLATERLEAKEHLRAETLRLYEQAKPRIPDLHDLSFAFGRAATLSLEKHEIPPPDPQTLEWLFKSFLSIYSRELTKYNVVPPELPTFANEAEERNFHTTLEPYIKRAQRLDVELLHRTTLNAFVAYWSRIPRETSTLTIPLSSTRVAHEIVVAICDLFWKDELIRTDAFSEMRDVQRHGAETAASRAGSKELIWAKDYKGLDVHKLYLPKTLWPLFDLPVACKFEDTLRFTHHWCLGHNGSGKTTYLRHFINADLDRVARSEASLIVMDSKKLIREMRTLKKFSTGQPWMNKLIIVDGDELFPLNPFKLPKQQGTPILVYMLAGLTDATKLQMGVLRHYIRAAYADPNPTLYTLRDLLSTPTKKLPLSRFDKNTRHWFENVRDNIHSATTSGVAQRLTDFLDEFEDTPLLRMFSANSFALDLNDLDMGCKALLVDTNRAAFGKDGAALLGRLVISLIDRLSTHRTNLPDSSYKPVFVHIDEAQDYIKTDEIFADILEKARASKVGVTVAHHHKGQIDTRIEQSLENAGIKSNCIDKGRVEVSTRRAKFTLPVSKFEFENEPQMTREEYSAMRRRMREEYTAKNAPLSRTKADGIEEPTEYR